MKKNIIIVTLLITNLISWLFYYFERRENQDLVRKIALLTPENKVTTSDVVKNTDCKMQEVYDDVSGTSMEPLIKNLAKVKVIENYYACNPIVERGDIIIYESFTTPGPIIKQVKALPGDVIVFENGRIYINGEIMKNSAWQEYIFRQEEVKYMSMYIQEWKLQDGSFFAFGDNLTYSIDSRKMGGLGIGNFKGKVVIR